MLDIDRIQTYLKEHELDGWLMADFHARNDIAVELLELKGVLTRRSFYFIPAEGEPTGLIPEIEKSKFTHLPGELKPFAGYREMERELANLLEAHKWVAMEYSRMGRLPYIGLVDAGTVEMVRSMGVEIVSSADLVAAFQARLTEAQAALHREAADILMEIKDGAFKLIADAVSNDRVITEYDVSRHILGKFKENDLVCEYNPICAVDANAGNPHYQPTADKSECIARGNLILIDLWAKHNIPDGIYGDITWMAYAGTREEIPEKYNKMFDVIVRARDAAITFIEENMRQRPVYGSEVDDACRAIIEEAGYGEYFTHRTGHSIGTHGHGSGPNIDNLETEDRRLLQSGHLFSIEPGIYMDDCGLRTEIDCLITDDGCEVTTLPKQTCILALL